MWLFFYCVFVVWAHTVCQGVFRLSSSRIYISCVKACSAQKSVAPWVHIMVSSFRWWKWSKQLRWCKLNYHGSVALPLWGQIMRSSRVLPDARAWIAVNCQELLGCWKGKDRQISCSLLELLRKFHLKFINAWKIEILLGHIVLEVMSGCVTLKLCEVLHTILFLYFCERYLKLCIILVCLVLTTNTVQRCSFSVTSAGLNWWKLITVINSGWI